MMFKLDDVKMHMNLWINGSCHIVGLFGLMLYMSTGMLSSILARHKSKPRVYIGCMKSGPVLTQK